MLYKVMMDIDTRTEPRYILGQDNREKLPLLVSLSETKDFTQYSPKEIANALDAHYRQLEIIRHPKNHTDILSEAEIPADSTKEFNRIITLDEEIAFVLTLGSAVFDQVIGVDETKHDYCEQAKEYLINHQNAQAALLKRSIPSVANVDTAKLATISTQLPLEEQLLELSQSLQHRNIEDIQGIVDPLTSHPFFDDVTTNEDLTEAMEAAISDISENRPQSLIYVREHLEALVLEKSQQERT